MKKKVLLNILAVLLVMILAGVSAVRAQERAFTLPWSVISSGGMGGTAGIYTIHSTLGQPVAGTVDGGTYHLTSGFWTEVIKSIMEFFNFLPLIIK